MLHSSLKLEPRTLFILQEPATVAARHAEPQGITSNLEIMAMGNVNFGHLVVEWHAQAGIDVDALAGGTVLATLA